MTINTTVNKLGYYVSTETPASGAANMQQGTATGREVPWSAFHE